MTNEEKVEFIKIIREIVQQEISKITNLEFSFFGKVEASVGGKFNVSIAGIEGVYTGLINKSGVALTVGDSVVVKAKNKDMGNAYIAIKCG